MSDETKPVVSKEETFDKLEIRLGQVVDVQLEPTAPKEAYRLTVDFGKFGKRTSVGRFARHSMEEIKGKKVLGVLNFEPRTCWRRSFRSLDPRGTVSESGKWRGHVHNTYGRR